MPVHHFVNDSTLVDKGLSNYWGYNTIGFLAPDPKYSSSLHSGGQVQEFKAMVRELHEADIEVILDVVYNHTAEGNHLGPTLSMRGIDNAAYYRLVEDDKRYYMDYTGTGNSLNVRHPHTLQLIMDSLRYWVTEMHVDGFRFDLASTLAREFYDVDRLSAFFELVQQDPTVEPGQADRRAVGRRPRRVSGGQLPAAVDGVERQVPRHRARLLARRGCDPRRVRLPADRIGRPVRAHRPPPRRLDQLRHRPRRVHTAPTWCPTTTSTTRPTSEDNRDGESHNRSWNCGAEGPTDDPEINALRAQPATQFPCHAFAFPGSADDLARR